MKLARLNNPDINTYEVKASEVELPETILFEGHSKFKKTLVAGIILTLIPPFFWGPLLIWLGVGSRKDKSIITEENFIILDYVGSKCCVREFPLDKFESIFMIPNPMNILNRFFLGKSEVRIASRDSDGTIWYTPVTIPGNTKFLNGHI